MMVTLITSARSGTVALLIKTGTAGTGTIVWDMGLSVGEMMQQVTHILHFRCDRIQNNPE